METSTSAAAQDTMWASRLEVLITISRVVEAIEALPSQPDALTVRRWNHGIARELWIAISAIGVEGASAMSVDIGQRGVQSVACAPLVHLFQAVSWRHRRLAFDISRLDHKSFLAAAGSLSNGQIGRGDNWGFPKWWTWSAAQSPEGPKMPGWWKDPTSDVGPPMPMFESDRADIEATSGKAYKTLAAVLFQKQCQLQDIEGRITDLKLSLED